MLKNAIIMGGVAALATGIAIGVQSLLGSRSSNLIGPINTSLWTNFIGGLLAGILILIFSKFVNSNYGQINKQAFFIILTSGALGILIMAGIPFSISRAGMAAGLASVIFGELLFGVLIDTLGFASATPIPLDLRRITGLIIMAISIFLLLPRK